MFAHLSFVVNKYKMFDLKIVFRNFGFGIPASLWLFTNFINYFLSIVKVQKFPSNYGFQVW